ncbi:MAG: LysR family transcriptional regulator [Christensenellaceae bacterium]|nr:LysR family transcriptional regulator [Christensenellaceae bacterium]MEA5066385.1 LysR family transcriptional regulator [Eubacteriales bacterium]MEA5067658.1 LysR family transcriptional regulator [Christensenellaceae bacterium]
MKFSQMRYFCSAYINRSITRAAQQLYVAQPTVTMAIRELEEELRVRLFERKNNRIVPTKEGEYFYTQACGILAQIEQVKQEMQCVAEKGTLIRIGVPYITAVYLIPEFMRFEKQFQSKYPQIHIQISEKRPEDVAVLLQEKQLDMAVNVLNDPHFAQFEGMMLCEHSIYLCLNKRHSLAKERVITPQMLKEETLATNYSEEAFPNQEIKRWFERAGCTPPRQIYLNQASTLSRLLSNNEVVALLRPEMVTIGRDIACVPIQDPIRLQLSIHWRRYPQMSSAMVSLLEELSRFRFITWR